LKIKNIILVKQHFNSYGSQWTKKYKPIKILELLSDCDNFDEDKYTLKYMEKYGINNVRGGTFCEIKLSKDNLETIKKMINSSTDKCYICGENGHFAKKCYQDEDNILEEFKNELTIIIHVLDVIEKVIMHLIVMQKQQ
jgi:hypothetical protein